jgi:hypothetical protein
MIAYILIGCVICAILYGFIIAAINVITTWSDHKHK